MSLTFKPTHRMLVRATTDHNYEVVDIDINHGTFKKCSVKIPDTKIRVNKSILGENLLTSKPLGLDELEGVASSFNEVRVAAGFPALSFRLTEEVEKKDEVSNR